MSEEEREREREKERERKRQDRMSTGTEIRKIV